MNSKQLNFFILPDDYFEIDNYLANEDILVSALPLTESKVRIVSGINQRLSDWTLVVLFKNSNELRIKTLDSKIKIGTKIYTIDTLRSSIVEFNKCYFYEKEKQLGRGRIYFIKRYYSENKLVEKPQSFIEWSECLLKFVRKYLVIIKEGKFKGFYASKQVIELMSKNQIELID